MAEQEQPEQPSELQQFQHQLRQDLGQFAQGVSQRLGAIEQRFQAPPPAQAPQIQVPPDINERLREKMIGDPLEYSKEIIGTATMQATAAARKVIEDERAQQAQAAQAQAFWQGFYSYPQNQDVGAFHDQLYAHFARATHLQDPSQRADFAADQVRQALKARADAQAQAEHRAKQNVRSGAASPGGQFMPAQAQGDYAPEMERRDPRAELQSAVDELAAQREKRMWNKIDTPEYRSTSRERDTKVAQDKYIAGGRRRSA